MPARDRDDLRSWGVYGLSSSIVNADNPSYLMDIAWAGLGHNVAGSPTPSFCSPRAIVIQWLHGPVIPSTSVTPRHGPSRHYLIQCNVD